MSLVLWIHRQHSRVDYPFAYMDDACGMDLSGQLIDKLWIEEDCSVVMPAQQGTLLYLWDELGIPYDFKKVESGRSLVITGFEIRLDEWDVSISPESVERLVEHPNGFLHPDKPRFQPVRRWQQALGYMTGDWA